MADNVLYYGDNLDILQRYISDESVDLIYLDPPFNSNANYNVFFEDKGRTQRSRSAAQLKAFEDTWTWDDTAALAYDKVTTGGGKVSQAMQAFGALLGKSDMLAYLSMMAPRLLELRRVLKPTGSIYLHCDPTASAHLRLLMDAVFGPEHFTNEIIWKRTHAHSGGKKLGAVHDTILLYSKSDKYVWNTQRVDYSEKYVETFFRFQDPDGRRYRATILTGSGTRTGSSGKPWRGIDPTTSGRHWAIPGYVRPLLGDNELPDVQSALDELDKIGRILWPAKSGGVPSFKQYQDDIKGTELQDVWTDIPPISAQGKERRGYPTQKPEALLERILQASSNEGDLVLDPFCGCGTTIVAAQHLGRRWVGIDITQAAIVVIKERLSNVSYTVIGEPVSVPDAQALAKQDLYQFQWWALGLVGARPTEQKKGADQGIDGRLYFHDENNSLTTKQVIFSVKAGQHIDVSMVRDLGHVVTREHAQIGVLISMEEPTQPMRAEVASAGFYHSPTWNQDYPRLQLRTVGELLTGKGIDMPPQKQVNTTFKKAPKARALSVDTIPMAIEVPGEDDLLDSKG